MAEHSGKVTGQNLLNDFMETFADSVPQQRPATLFESSEKSPVSESFKRLFGRQKPVHHLLGGGKSADVLLWRNKRISGSVLAGATFMWLLLEWLEYQFVTLICIGLVLFMTILFFWSKAATFLNRSPPRIPRISLPEEMFINAAIALRNEINRFLSFLQDVASGRDLKTFLMVAGGLFLAAIIGTWCNFLTIVYIGLVAAHTLPVLYEKYEDQIDSYIYDALDKLKRHYGRFDSQVLGRIPKGPLKGKKSL